MDLSTYKNSVEHDPENGLYGDCYRVCIAWLLRVPPSDVPHFAEDGPDSDWQDRERKWLADRGLSSVSIPFMADNDVDGVLNTIACNNLNARYMLCGAGKAGVNHCVGCEGDAIVMDSTGSGVEGPTDDGFFWVEFLSPL